MKLKEWIKRAYLLLKINKIKNNNYEPEIILSYVLKISYEKILLIEDKFLSFKKFIILEKLLKMKLKNIPIPYLTKKKEFYSINFSINNKVFIPRSNTEYIIDFIIKNTKKYHKYKILDLETGVDSIAILLAKNLPKSSIIGIDINKDAIKLSKINSINLKINNVNFYNKD